ncbi:MAG: hypothetical protein ACOCP4_07565 [Candidatus Woesearchaeota archaeon]
MRAGKGEDQINSDPEAKRKTHETKYKQLPRPAEVSDEDIINYLKTLPAPTKATAKICIEDVRDGVETWLKNIIGNN